jgi:hypothetical protein
MSYSATFKAKLGEVNHHLITAKGNDGYEGYSIYYCNIANSENQNKMTVKFLAPDNDLVKYYEWDFGDGTILKTLLKEVEHKYDLYNKSEWLTHNGELPHTPSKTGNYANVKLTVYPLNTPTSAVVYTGTAAIYEITGDSPEIYGYYE